MPDEPVPSPREIDGLPAFEVAQWTLSEQFRTIEQLDLKVERVFGAALAVVTLAAAGVTFVVGQGDDAISIVALMAAVPVLTAFSWAALFF